MFGDAGMGGRWLVQGQVRRGGGAGGGGGRGGSPRRRGDGPEVSPAGSPGSAHPGLTKLAPNRIYFGAQTADGESIEQLQAMLDTYKERCSQAEVLIAQGSTNEAAG
jgi:hypothetical protein